MSPGCTSSCLIPVQFTMQGHPAQGCILARGYEDGSVSCGLLPFSSNFPPTIQRFHSAAVRCMLAVAPTESALLLPTVITGADDASVVVSTFDLE